MKITPLKPLTLAVVITCLSGHRCRIRGDERTGIAERSAKRENGASVTGIRI